MSNRRALSNAVKESKQPKQLSKPKDIILDPMGQWKHPGENTRIPSNNITMQGVSYPVLAKPNVGQPIMMQPGQDYNFPEADYVDEFPKFAGGGMVEPTMDENGEPKCPDGYDYNSATGYCEKKSSKCPDGYKPDGKGGCIEDRCQPGYEKDASGNCVPDTSGAVYVEDENDPRYQDYLTRRKLNHISNIENPEIRSGVYSATKLGDKDYDVFYNSDKGYTFPTLEKNDNNWYNLKDPNTGNILYRSASETGNKGDYGSDIGLYTGLNKSQINNLENYVKSQGYNTEDVFNFPYAYALDNDDYIKKYKPSKYDIRLNKSPYSTTSYSHDLQGNLVKVNTDVIEDKINRDRLRKLFPNLSDSEINKIYIQSTDEYRVNPRDLNSLNPHLLNLGLPISQDEISDAEHLANIEKTKSLPFKVYGETYANPETKAYGYKPESIFENIQTDVSVVPYYDAPTDNYKFATQPKSAELIQETQRAVPKFDDPELNLKKGNLPGFTTYGPLKDRKHIHYNNPFIVGTSNKPLNWAPYSAALRAFTGYKKGDEKKLNNEVKAAREEGRPVNFEGIPLMGKTDLKHRRAYKKALKEYEKNLPAIELENERRRQQHEQELKGLNLRRQAEEAKRIAAGLDPDALVEWKKGGGLKSKKYSRSLQATNKFFREHSFFEKPKKLSKKRIYDPNAKYFEDGGENDCPTGYVKDENGNCVWHDPAQENSIINKSAIHPVEYSRSQLTMGDPFYNTHTVALNDKNQAAWQLKNEDQIKTNLRNTTLKNFIQRHPEDSSGLELGYLHNNIWTSPTLGLEKDTFEPGYAPNQLGFERDGKHPNVYFIKNSVKGSAEAPSSTYSRAFQDYVNKDLSKNNAYNKVSNDLGKALLEKGYKGENMWGKDDEDQLIQLYGTEGSTLKGATEVTPETLKYLQSIKDSEEGKRHLAKLAGISEDDPDYADMIMHYNTTPIDVYAETARPENNDLIRTEEEIPEEQTFLRNTEGPTNYQDGGLTVGTSTSYPSGIGVGALANYVPSQMANLKLANSFKFKDVKTPLEVSVGTPLGGVKSRSNTYQGFMHPDDQKSSIGDGVLPEDAIQANKANFSNWQSSNKGAPIDLRVKQSFFGIPQDKNNPLRGFASVQGGYHPQTGFNAGIEGGVNLVLSRNGQANRYFSNRGLIPKQTVFVPQLTMGYGVRQKQAGWKEDTLNEYENLLNQDAQNNTTGSIDYLNKEVKKGNLSGGHGNVAFRPQLTVESRPTRSPLTLHGTVGANVNLAGGNRPFGPEGSGVKAKTNVYGEVGARYPVDKLFDKKSKAKSKIQEVQDREQEYEKERPVKPVEQKEPKEQTEWIGEHPRWLRDGGSTDNYVEIDIPKDQIQKYVDGGYIVEDISVPELNTYAEGGEADYQLGDEIDEATMKRLKKLGYTFEEI